MRESPDTALKVIGVALCHFTAWIADHLRWDLLVAGDRLSRSRSPIGCPHLEMAG
jgi:hypothetical protein